jgi:hypothetical protein
MIIDQIPHNRRGRYFPPNFGEIARETLAANQQWSRSIPLDHIIEFASVSGVSACCLATLP